MTRLILVRHGETDSKKNGVLRGREDIELNEEGEEQAEKLAERISDEEDVDTVYSSDLKRASKTAEKISEAADSLHIEREELRERDWGEFGGRDPEDRREVLENGDDLDKWVPEKGENLDDIRRRVRPLIEEIEEKHPSDTVVVAAHAWVNRAVMMELLDADGRGHSIKQGNTAVNVLEKEGFRGWRIVKVNDTRHLES